MREPDDATTAPDAWTERTGADVASLMVELGRVVRGISFYGRDNPATSALVDRALRAWRADLERAGPLALSVSATGVEAEGLAERVGIDHLPELSLAFGSGRIGSLRFGGALERESFLGLAAALDPRRASEADAGALHALPGIEVDGVATPLGAPAAPARTLGALRLEEPPEDDDPDAKPSRVGRLAPDVADGRQAALYAGLAALEDCVDDDAYAALATDVGDLAADLAAEGEVECVQAALLLLADHTSGAGRSAPQARLASGKLVELAVGSALDELILRACSADPVESVRSARALLAVGQPAAWATLDRLEAEPEGRHAPQLSGLLVALGDAATPCLSLALRGGNKARSGAAIRIAADVQTPALVEPLGEHLCAPGALPRAAAKALVEIGSAAAVDALLAGLQRNDARVAEISASSLAALGAPRAIGPLVERLHVATRDREWRLVTELLVAIGQFDTCGRATAERLKSWICQPRVGVRRPSLELRLDGITALGRLSGHSVDRALQDVARGRRPRAPARVRERAQRILERRSADARRAPSIESLQ